MEDMTSNGWPTRRHVLGMRAMFIGLAGGAISAIYHSMLDFVLEITWERSGPPVTYFLGLSGAPWMYIILNCTFFGALTGLLIRWLGPPCANLPGVVLEFHRDGELGNDVMQAGPLFSSSPPHLFTSSPPHLLTSSPPHLLTSSPPHLFTSSSRLPTPRLSTFSSPHLLASPHLASRVVAQVLNEAAIVCTTLSCAGYSMFSQLKQGFDTVLIDEAAQAVEMSTLIPLK